MKSKNRNFFMESFCQVNVRQCIAGYFVYQEYRKNTIKSLFQVNDVISRLAWSIKFNDGICLLNDRRIFYYLCKRQFFAQLICFLLKLKQ